jgi:CheY-like chemotaxis protein
MSVAAMPSTNVVLIVEDDDATREAFALILAGAGYRVRTAAGAEMALDALKDAEPPDLILLDLMMPGMDGYQFRRHQLADERLAGIPVIVCSACCRARDRTGLDGVAYLHKPVEPAALVEAVRLHC